jgi:hypothetical protein
MGYEYCVTLQSGEYSQTVLALAEAFEDFREDYAVIGDESGFTLLCPDDRKWPERLQIAVNFASSHTGVVPEGVPYLYCLFHIGGNEAYRAMERIKATLNRLGFAYALNDL